MKKRPFTYPVVTLAFTATALLVASTFWHCSSRTSGRQSPAATASPAASATHLDSPTAATRAAPLGRTGWALTYAFSFPSRLGKVAIFADARMLRIDETWEGGEAHASSWGTTRARLLFDSTHQTLTIINLTTNTYTLLTERKLDEVRKTMSAKRTAAPRAGALITTETPGPEGDPLTPRPMDKSTKAHPTDCAVYERALPSGLEEESCYRTWDAVGIAPRALDDLLAFRIHIREIDHGVPELAVVSQLAEALAWDLGVVVSQFTFGISPLDPDEPSDKPAPWDKSFELKEVRPYSFQSVDFALPKDATKSDELLPWRAPFLFR